MDDYRKQSKIDKLNLAFPGMNCGNPHCEELCAEVYDAAKAMRLDPVEAIRKTVERELHCRQADKVTKAVCRFGFEVRMDSLILTGEKNRKDNIIHIFRTGVDECKKCQDLDGTRILPEDWASESKMKEKGFWKQKNGEYLPHPHCRCHWEEEILIKKAVEKDSQEVMKPAIVHAKKEKENQENDNYTGKSVTAKVKDVPGPLWGVEYEFQDFNDLLTQLEKKNSPHSIGKLVLIIVLDIDNIVNFPRQRIGLPVYEKAA